jgi:hypothetical protein
MTSFASTLSLVKGGYTHLRRDTEPLRSIKPCLAAQKTTLASLMKPGNESAKPNGSNVGLPISQRYDH